MLDAITFWKQALVEAPRRYDLPATRARPVPTGEAARSDRGVHAFGVAPELAERLAVAAAGQGASLEATLATAFAWLLHRHGDQPALRIALVDGAGESLPVPCVSDRSATFASAAISLMRFLSAARSAGAPDEALLAELGEEGLAADCALLFCDGDVGPSPPVEGCALACRLVPHAGGYRGSIGGTALDAPGAERFAERFLVLLEAIADDPLSPLAELAWYPEQERTLVLETWNATARAYPRDETLASLFARQALATPKACAVRFRGETLTYAELDAAANRLAHRLRALGVKPGMRVALCVERSLAMPVALVAICKAGGAYVPLDPTYPSERLAAMIADAAPAALLTEGVLDDRLPPFEGPVLDLDGDPGKGMPSEEPEPLGSADDPAYVIFTSGSTGRPKGVVARQRGVARLVLDPGYIDIRREDVFLQLSPLSFDAATFEIWGALLNGATLAIAEPGRIDPPAVARTIREAGVTVLWLTAALFDEFTAHHLDGLAGLRVLLAGGDVLPTAAIARVLEGLPQTMLVNGYGPTETTTFATAFTFPRDWRGREAPIGRPIGNTRTLVLDEDMRPQPIGAAGELYIGGDGNAAGYLGRPDLTQSAFVPDPFGAPDETLYRTGDRVLWNDDGTLAFLGRADAQVKLRGFRIELGEIETVLGAASGVAQAAAALREDVPGDKRIAAYVVPAAGASVDVEGLRLHLAARLPEYMMPADIVSVERLPVTPNGKLDRRALPVPPRSRADALAGGAPTGSVETRLAALWTELLRIEGIGREDDFFVLGGHSLLVGRLVARIRTTFAVELPLAALYEAPTLADMAALVEAKGAGLEIPPPPPPLLPRGEQRTIPLSFPQERIWFIEQFAPENLAYQMQATIRLDGPLDPNAMRAALTEIVRRHEVFRTAFKSEGGAPVQEIFEPYEVDLPLVDLPGGSAEEFEARVAEIVRDDVQVRYRLDVGPLAYWKLLRHTPERHVLLHMEHHMIHDGWSLSVFLDELMALYTAFSRGEPSPLAPPLRQFADLAVWQRNWMTGDTLEAYVAHWTKRLASPPDPLDLPTDRPRPPAFSFVGSALRVTFDPAEYAALRRGARANDVTLFTAMLTGFATLVSRYCDQPDLVIGAGSANRRVAEAERVIGMVINTLPLRVDIADDPSFIEAMRRVHRTAVDAYTWQDVPLDRLVEALGLPRDPSRNPLFSTIFSFHDAAVPDLAFGDAKAEITVEQNGSAKADINIIVIPRAEQRIGRAASAQDESLTLIWEYNGDLFTRESMERMLAAYRRLMRAALAEPQTRVSALPLATPPSVPAPPSASVADLLAARFEQDPAAVAIVAEGGEASTYETLDLRSRALAEEFAAAGAGPRRAVALALPQGIDLTIALVAAARLGAPILVLAPDSSGDVPAGAVLVHRPDGAAPRVVAPAIADETAVPGTIDPRALPAVAAALARDGVACAHVLQLAPSGSDLLALETFAALLAGGCLHPRSVAQDVPAIATLLADASVPQDATLALPGALADALAAHRPEALDRVGAVLAYGEEGGDAPALAARARVFRAVGAAGAPLLALAPLRAERSREEALGFFTGIPAPGLGLVVRDAAGAPRPLGVWGRVDRIVGGSEAVSTGRRGRLTGDGRLQLRGPLGAPERVGTFRVNRAEVRAALLADPQVGLASVVLRSGALHAYVVPVASAPLDREKLEDRLAETLGSYQHPRTITVLPDLPLNALGEIDVAALPQPAGEPIRLERMPGMIEDGIAAMCAALLGREHVDPHEDFFLLGGRSLLATRLVAQANERFGVSVPLARFMRRPTVADLAAAIAAAQVGAPEEALRPSAKRNAADLLARIDELSEAEVKQLLEELG